VKCFTFDLDAGTIALLIKLNRNVVNRYLSLIRRRIADLCKEKSPFQGENQVDQLCFSEKAMSILKSFPIGPGRPSWPLSEAQLNQTASYIQIIGGAMTVWLTWGTKSMAVFIMAPTKSMALNPSGHLRNEGLLNFMVSHNQPFTCTSRNVSFGSTTVTPISINCC